MGRLDAYHTRSRPGRGGFQLTLEISVRARNFWIARCLASRSVASISLELIVATTTETGFAWRNAMGGDGVVADEAGGVMT
jgi:hypothetical protein